MQAKSVGKLAAHGVGLAACVASVPSNVAKKCVVVETSWLRWITVKRLCCSCAICELPFGFRWQAQTCYRHETTRACDHVPIDSFNWTRRAVRLPLKITRIAPHLRRPLSLSHFITTNIKRTQCHLVRRVFVGRARIRSRRAATHRECPRWHQQHLDVRSVVSHTPRQTRCSDCVAQGHIRYHGGIWRPLQHSCPSWTWTYSPPGQNKCEIESVDSSIAIDVASSGSSVGAPRTQDCCQVCSINRVIVIHICETLRVCLVIQRSEHQHDCKNDCASNIDKFHI